MPRKDIKALEDAKPLLISKIFDQIVISNVLNSFDSNKHKKSKPNQRNIPIRHINNDQIIGAVSEFYVNYNNAQDQLERELNTYRFGFTRKSAQQKGEKKLEQMIHEFLSDLKLNLNTSKLTEIQKALLCVGCLYYEPEPFLKAVENNSVLKLRLLENAITSLAAKGLDDCQLFLNEMFKYKALDRFIALHITAKIFNLPVFASGEVPNYMKLAYQLLFDGYLGLQNNACRNKNEFALWLDLTIALFKLQSASERLETLAKFKLVYDNLDPKVVTKQIPEIYKQLEGLVLPYGTCKPLCSISEIQVKSRVSLKSIENQVDDLLKFEHDNIPQGQSLVCLQQKLDGKDDDALVYEFANLFDAKLYSMYCLICKPDDVYAWFSSQSKLELKKHEPVVIQKPTQELQVTEPQTYQAKPKVEPIKRSMLTQFKHYACRYTVPILAAGLAAGGAVILTHNRDMMPKF